MFTRSAQVVAAVVAVELLVFALAATRVDVLLLMLVLVALSVLGGAFLFRQTTDLVRRSVDDARSASPSASRQIGDRSLKVLGGLLLLFPGLLTGAAGALLLLPPVRALVRPVIGARIGARIPAELSASLAELNRTRRRRDVIDVAEAQRAADGSGHAAAPPELR